MTESPRTSSIYSIPPGVPFVDALAAGILKETGGDAGLLAGYRIFLPTRRAVRALREAFLRQSGGAALLLPRMLPLGDLDEDALAIAGWEEIPSTGAAAIPPAISGIRRHLILTRLVQQFEGGQITPDQAARLARELARLIDQIQTERLSYDGLADLVPEEFAVHWQETLKFLQIVTNQWPEILAGENAIDPAERRNRLLAAQANRWRQNPTDQPVIASGSTGSVPATADLLTVIANLPNGRVVLPGLDVSLDGDAIQVLDDVHPQSGMVRLLDRLGVEISDVNVWPADADGAGRKAGEQRRSRARLVSRALLPAPLTDRWHVDEEVSAAALGGISRAEFGDPEEEARAIALMMRGAIEVEGRTAALATPDRQLARRVAGELRRWKIEIDDSAGLPLNRTAVGVFLSLTVQAVAEEFAPVPLLALSKHPLAANGANPAAFRRQARILERYCLRGARPAPGLEPLGKGLSGDHPETAEWIGRFHASVTELAALYRLPAVPPSRLIEAHVSAAEALAATDELSGAERLWAGEEGEAAANFISELSAAIETLEAIAPGDYPSLLATLMEGVVVRSQWGTHPRLFIWGLLEARLQHADLMILGGLNEGTWPPEAEADPWMSRPMRAAFGLPSPERRVGLTAHDFVQACGAPEVVLTRAARIDGTPAVPSRWLLRLDTMLARHGASPNRLVVHDWNHWQSMLDHPAAPDPIMRPAPSPPVSARPRRLSVTQVETWMRDPYAVYARHVLGLSALDPIEMPPSAAEYGTIIHEALSVFVQKYPADLPRDPKAELLAIGREEFADRLQMPGVWAFWWPRFERIADWFVAEEEQRRKSIIGSYGEVEGRTELAGPAGPFLLTAKADRIDLLDDGSLRIVDYKTGSLPSGKEVTAGFSPQLPLEALIAERGGFKGIEARTVSALDYWRLRGTVPAGETRTAAKDSGRLADEAHKGLSGLISVFDRDETVYEARPRPEDAPKYSDYEHLARVKEWASAADGGES